LFKSFTVLALFCLNLQAEVIQPAELRASIDELRAMVISQQKQIQIQQEQITILQAQVDGRGRQSREDQSYGISEDHGGEVVSSAGEGGIPGRRPTSSDALVESKIPVVKGVSENFVTSKFGAEFYGYLKTDVIFTSQDVSLDTVPLFVRQRNGSNDDGQFNMSAKESRFGAKLKGPDIGSGALTGLVEFDFYGDFSDISARHAYKLRSRQLYVNYGNEDWSILAGKSWETYLSVFPQLVNFSSYNLMGQLGMRKEQLRFTKNYTIDEQSKITVKVALAEPLGGIHGGDLDEDGVDDGAESDLPNFEYLIAYSLPMLTDQPSTFALSGFYGEEKTGTTQLGADKKFESYAFIAGLTFPITEKLLLKGTLWTGTNLDAAWGGIGQGINLLKGETIDATGGWAQLGYQATDKLKLNLGYSFDDPQDSDLNIGDRSKNSSFLVNGFYSFSPNFILGFEYMRLETGYYGEKDEAADWLQSSLIYKF